LQDDGYHMTLISNLFLLLVAFRDEGGVLEMKMDDFGTARSFWIHLSDASGRSLPSADLLKPLESAPPVGQHL